MFLLRKGVPVGRLSFNVVDTADDESKNIGTDDGSSSEGNRNYPAEHSNSTSTDIYKSSHNSHSHSNGIDCINPIVAAEEVGRGYDANIPAVFKAKVRKILGKFGLVHEYNALRNLSDIRSWIETFHFSRIDSMAKM